MTTGKPILAAILARLGGGAGDAVFRLAQFQLLQQLGEAVAVFGEVDGVGRGAENGHAACFECLGELQRRLAAELDDDAVERAVLLLGMDDLEHVLGGQRTRNRAGRRCRSRSTPSPDCS